MQTLLKISEAASIALHAMALLSEYDPTILMSNKEISHKLGVSEAHLSKVLQRLEKAGLVSSVRGPRGGFKLNKKGSEITLLEIYEVIEGNIGDHQCLLPKPICKDRKCLLGTLLIRINKEVKDYLQKTTLDGLEGFPPIHKKGR